MMSAPSAFILEWNSMQPTPSPRSTSEAPEFFLTTPVGLLRDLDRPDSRGNFDRLCNSPWSRSQVASARWGFRVVLVPGLLSGGEQFLYVGRYRTSFFLHAGDGCFDAGGVPEFEGAEFPVEAEAHGAVDLDDGVGNFGNAIGGIGPQVGERGPKESAGLVGLLRRAAVAEPSSIRTRAPVSSTFFAMSSAANFGFCRG